ncbi:GNAT family N-acetyltransferase [Streptomyces candidus]|uniref:GNAT superfamily N-acetyltransferase n=1 Tax=Streptomyces candidus TaxID=67283 RepID=A0A7X0HHC6_9ACTN|nr:GNAT family N-acetyltransferase [Streptomyces candidus]MBB6437680.1 GNAT superfamily N-acetyltransferase [Streptomyces candidus]GHH53385.1 N-acetyltransferase [Streptomyces candidus]
MTETSGTTGTTKAPGVGNSLVGFLDSASRGVFPPPDGGVTVVPQAEERVAGVLSFTAHSVIFTDADPEWVRTTLAATPCDPLAASMNPVFLVALAERTGRRMNDTIDMLSMAPALPGPPDPELGLREIDNPAHSRVARARAFREGVRVWTAAEGGVLVLGRGVAGRWEAAIEVDEAARGRGLGRRLALAARQLVPGAVVWAQQPPGNARSVRAFQGAGYRAVGSEVLMVRGDFEG